jgi:AcrR family transcriptional regulator
MLQVYQSIQVPVNPHLFIKDPITSELGNNILNGSIELIDSLGFERFTFKKLAREIQTTEASIYRYFENKNKLLLYLTNWYWGCIATRLLFETKNINCAIEKLKKAIHVLTALPNPSEDSFLKNEQKLKQLVINESSKVVITKEVDQENKSGIFSVYKGIVNSVVEIIKEINKEYPYPNMLVSNMIEGSNQQRFFAKHLPRLTNSRIESDLVEEFYMDLVFKTIQNDEK